MSNYQLTSTNLIIRLSDGASIPPDPNNRDYQTYLAWLAAGNQPASYTPPAQTPLQQFNAALANGINTVWATTSPLNGLYAIDQQMQFNITAESVMILTNGTFSTGGTTRYWPNMVGTPMPMTIAQFQAFATAVAVYVDSLYAVLNALQAGQTNTPWPNNQATVNA